MLFFKKIFTVFFVVALVANNFLYTFAQSIDTQISATTENDLSQTQYVPGEVIVKFKTEKINLKKSSGGLQLNAFEENNDLDAQNILSRDNIAVLKIQDNQTVEDKITQLESDPNVQYVQPNFVYQIEISNPNDTDFGKLR
ncbi:TPA: hypothetical protein DCZ39_06015 [Patescibacteria group bacterium]|nr:hypothetical protein [Candidatus Gracilibacteria bacterium]